MNNRVGYKTYTFSDFLSSNGGVSEVTYNNFSILEKLTTEFGDVIHCTNNNIIDDYMYELKEASEIVEMSVTEQNKYFYNVGLLAFDLYGSVELEFVILKLNGIIDPKEFDIKNVRLIKATKLLELLSAIYNAEVKFLTINRETEGIEAV